MSKPTSTRDVDLVKKISEAALDIAATNDGAPIDIVTRLRAAMYLTQESGLTALYEKLKAAEEAVKL